MIFGSLPKKRTRSNSPTKQRKRLRRLNTKENQKTHDLALCSPELKSFVEKLVDTEMDEFLRNAKQESALNENTIKRRLIRHILDNQRLRNHTDMRTVQKMRALVKNHVVGLLG